MLRVMSSKERGQRLRAARKAAGFEHAVDAANSLGIKIPTYRAYENGGRNFDAEEAQFFGRRFKTPFEWLLFGPGLEPPPYAVLPETQGDIREADVPAPLLSELKNDVPIMGTSAGPTAGSFKISASMVDVAPRVRGIMSARNVYAIFPVGHSMDPAHPAGELRYVNPNRPTKPGDTVVVRTRPHDGSDDVCYLGILVSEDEKHVTVRKLNPPSTTKHAREIVTGVHKVLTMNELMGV